MKIEAKLIPPKNKKNKLWGVEIPLLEIHTQGKSKEDAYLMAADAVESLVNKKGFKIICQPEEGSYFTLTANDQNIFLAFVLARLRLSHKLTAREVASRLNSNSPNAYARYEQAKAIPKFDTLELLLKAINPKLHLVLKAR